MVQGYLGVLHREFEKNWMSAKRGVNDLALDNKYCIILNTQNIDDLYKLSYLEYFEDDLDGFCKEVSNLLDKILEDIACLREVFAQNELAGIELEKFVGYGQRDKFEEFKLFVTGMN